MPINCNFFALLKDDSVKKIELTQSVTEDIRNIFINSLYTLLNDDTEQILFDGNFNVTENEILYVEKELPTTITEANSNPIGIEVLNLSDDDIKALFWIEDNIYYFQNFDKRKLLQNKSVIFWNNNTFNKLNENAFIVDNSINAIHKEGKFYFKSYANANKIIPLIDFFEAASDIKIDEFAQNDKLTMDAKWLKENSNNDIRKHITFISKSNILKKANPNKIKKMASKFSLNIDLDNNRIKLPNNKKECKEILYFLNEQYYEGLISKKKFKTNSKREI